MADKKKNEPVIADEELKMPEQPFGEPLQQTKEVSMLGPILGVIIVVLVLILGGLYLWGSSLRNQMPEYPFPQAERPSDEQNNEPESNNAEADTQALRTVSTSDELSAIEADVESTNLDSLDAELNAIDAEIDASAQ